MSPLEGVLARLAGILPLVAEHTAWAEAERRPHAGVMAALARAGLLRLLAPAAYGGEELTLAEFLAVVEATSAVDGSAGWTLMTTNEEFEIASAYLPAATITELLAQRPDVIVAGSGLTSGRARRGGEGWVLEGRWRFVTGSPAADYLVVGSVVVDGTAAGGVAADGVAGDPDRPRPLCFALFPASSADLLDTWRVDGLRGTGSHDVAVHDLFVPDAWSGVVSSTVQTRPDGAFYRLPPALRFPFPKVGVAAGIARGAIAEFVALANEKTPTLSRSRLRDRPDAAAAVAEAEALRASGWSWVRDVLGEVWDHAVAGRPVPSDLHARARLACSFSVRSSVRAVELVCSAAGSTANFVESPLSRRFRDVHAVPQHFTVAPYQMDTAGRVLLGLRADDPSF